MASQRQDPHEETVAVGRRIRRVRKEQSLTLKDLAERTGLSTPHLSQIENGRVNVNVTNLTTIARALGVPVVSFFQDGETPRVSLTRRDERRWFDVGEGAAESYLIRAMGNLEIFTISLAPGARSGEPSSHAGEEFTYVIRGRVTVTLDGYDPFELSEGDIVYYASDIAHFWRNPGDKPTELLVVNTPATY